jgi:hypothetical protein
MRHVLATPGLDYFRTTHLFFPFGAPIANHPHTALPALVAATVLKRASAVAALNVLLLTSVFLNMAVMYALAWTLTGHRRASILAGIVFGTSPYLAAQLLGHFDLMAAWVLPAFALVLGRAVKQRSAIAAATAGAIVGAAAYIAYYYVVYLLLFGTVYLTAWSDAVRVGFVRRALTPGARRVRRGALILCGLLCAVAMWIVLTGGATVSVGPMALPAHTAQGALTGMWLSALVAAAATWRMALDSGNDSPARVRTAVRAGAVIAAVFLVVSAPLLREAARLIAAGEYSTQVYNWRSAPRGIDLLAPLLGPPRHPLVRDAVRQAYSALHQDEIEAVGWIGVVPMLLLLAGRPSRDGDGGERRAWQAAGAIFALWAVGPFLTIGGFDIGLKMPQTLARFVPLVANARMPGRAIVGVFMVLGVLLARRLARSTGWLARPAIQWAIIALVAFEYLDAPVPMTPLDAPQIYRQLAEAPDGALCEVPLGIGDGLSKGIGSQERRVLYYATIHEHPLVGGYLGRMPREAAAKYGQMPVVASLLALSDGRSADPPRAGERPPCLYLMVHRAAASPALRAYVEQLAGDRLASDEERDLYRLRP